MKLIRGTRIQVVGRMPGEPDPIPVGTTGTVIAQENYGTQYEQTWVDWDNGRNLMLIREDYPIIKVLS